MAIVSGPLHSDAASGKLAGSMVFSRWKGRAYVRQLVTPNNPKSAKQTGVRAMMGFLAAQYKLLTSSVFTGWTASALARQISEFNAMVSENLARWQLAGSPTQVYPAAEASTPLTVTTQTLTGFEGYATVAVTPSGDTNIWGIAIFRDTAEITVPNWANCVAVLPADGTNAVTFTDSPLAAGTYHYRTAVFNTDGVLGTVKADDDVTVT
jgi:hypothetical protein